MPLLSALRTLSVGTLLGPQKERQVNWYLQPVHLEKLLGQLTPQLEKIAQIIQHYAISVCDFLYHFYCCLLFPFLETYRENCGCATLIFFLNKYLVFLHLI